MLHDFVHPQSSRHTEATFRLPLLPQFSLSREFSRPPITGAIVTNGNTSRAHRDKRILPGVQRLLFSFFAGPKEEGERGEKEKIKKDLPLHKHTYAIFDKFFSSYPENQMTKNLKTEKTIFSFYLQIVINHWKLIGH